MRECSAAVWRTTNRLGRFFPSAPAALIAVAAVETTARVALVGVAPTASAASLRNGTEAAMRQCGATGRRSKGVLGHAPLNLGALARSMCARQQRTSRLGFAWRSLALLRSCCFHSDPHFSSPSALSAILPSCLPTHLPRRPLWASPPSRLEWLPLRSSSQRSVRNTANRTEQGSARTVGMDGD